MFIRKKDYYDIKERISFLEDLCFNDFIKKRIKDLEEAYEIKIVQESFYNNEFIIYDKKYTNLSFRIYGPRVKNKKDILLYLLGPFEDDLKSKLYEKRIQK